MIRSFLRNGNRSHGDTALYARDILGSRPISASISTNTAINKSLRRSQNVGDRSGRRLPFRKEDRSGSLGDPPYPHDRLQRNNRRRTDDVAHADQHEKISERYQALKRRRSSSSAPGRSRSNSELSVVRGSTIDARSRKSPSDYDYSPNPGGNRVTRRAATFGHKIEPPSHGESIVSKRRAADRQSLHMNKRLNSPRRGPSDESTLDVGDEASREFSLPEDLRDDFEDPSIGPRRSFTMGRQVSQDGAFSSYRNQPSQDRNRDIGHHEQDAPLSLPYTTPASEFLYGTSVVVAALLSTRRKLYKLYIYDGEKREVRDQDLAIRKMALKREVVVEKVKGDWLRVMDKMSTGRPHNGYILEASPLPKLPVIGLRSVEKRQGPFHVMLDHQSREEEEVNGTDPNIKYEVGFPRYPFVLLLDGILDPGNLGAILRTAFFLGVDVVAIGNRSSAPVSPVALKASAGASESLPLMSVNQPGMFIDICKKNGWRVYAAATPGPDKRSGFKNYFSTSQLGCPLRDHPCIVIIGGEGEGLRWNIQKKAEYEIGIEGQRNGQDRVDSLNVSVATGLLCEAFLRKPETPVHGALDSSTPHTLKGGGAENLLF